MRGGHLVEEFRRQVLQAGLEQFESDQQRHRAADEEHHQREHQVQGTDVLVVGGVEPPLEEALLVTMVIVVVGVVGPVGAVTTTGRPGATVGTVVEPAVVFG